MNNISAVIITLNEERNIGRCIESLLPVADEIIVVDSFSTDRTQDICQSYGVRFFQVEWMGYAPTKNYANGLASHPYILSIDADEALSDELQAEIIQLKKTGLQGAYKLNRLTNYCGKWIRHCGWYPDVKVRLWDKQTGEWSGVLHEEILFATPVSVQQLKGHLYHYSYHSIHQHINQFNAFTEIGAKQAFEKGKRSNLFKILFNPVWKFIRDYFIKLGFLDGYYGFLICAISAFATFSKYIKMKELQR